MLKYNGRIITKNDRWIGKPKYNPLGLDDYTLRIEFYDDPDYVPQNKEGRIFTRVSTSPNVWDMYWPTNNWYRIYDPEFNNKPFDILGGNLKEVTNFESAFDDCKVRDVHYIDMRNATNAYRMFATCGPLRYVRGLHTTNKLKNVREMFEINGHLKEIELFDTSGVTDMDSFIWACGELEYIPNFDVSSVEKCGHAFRNLNVSDVPDFNFTDKLQEYYILFYDSKKLKHGMYNIYCKFRDLGLSPVPSVFYHAGIDTEEGRAERALIPESWGGDLVEE